MSRLPEPSIERPACIVLLWAILWAGCGRFSVELADLPDALPPDASHVADTQSGDTPLMSSVDVLGAVDAPIDSPEAQIDATLGAPDGATNIDTMQPDTDLPPVPDDGMLRCRFNPDCNAGLGAICEDNGDCNSGFCCTARGNCNSGMCTIECDDDDQCPSDMACEHGVCFFRCSKDEHCAMGMSCEHMATVCEWP